MTTPPTGPVSPRRGEVTRLLSRWTEGDADALDDLLPLLYAELRQLAASQLRRERSEHTLQPTALVHEAYVRLVREDPGRVENRTHFFAVAARAMRQILVDHARRHAADKRLGRGDKVSLEEQDEDRTPGATSEVDLVELNDVLDRLGEIQPRAARVVELRYFGGLTQKEAAAVLGVSLATVEREWLAARIWLRSRLGGGVGPRSPSA